MDLLGPKKTPPSKKTRWTFGSSGFFLRRRAAYCVKSIIATPTHNGGAVMPIAKKNDMASDMRRPDLLRMINLQALVPAKSESVSIR